MLVFNVITEKGDMLQMDLIHLNDKEKDFYQNEMIEILTASDNDFVPPLSKRRSTLDKFFFVSEKGSVALYFEEMKKQEIICAIDNGKILGFVSYRLDYAPDEIDLDKPNIYVSTLVLSESARGKGLTKIIYSHLFYDMYPNRSIFTRTWSTNAAHTKILMNFGFSEIYRKKNDRGDGIDTVYYKKEKSKKLVGVCL